MMVRNQIVCFDDFERRGKGLDTKDVLGLISFLREQRNCKVALILNDERLEGHERIEFETHLEKVLDISLVYEPSAPQAAAIGAAGEAETKRIVADRCSALGITNIRTIKRAVQFVESIEPKLANQDPKVLGTAIRSLVLFCWCRDQPDEAPPLDYLESKRLGSFGNGWQIATKGEPESDESRWSARLQAYGYLGADDFDLVLIEAVRKGYFNDERLASEARKLSAKFAKGRADGYLEEAWRRVSNSFHDDQDAVLDGIRDAFFKNIEYVAPATLNATVKLFKELGRETEAADMIARYVAARGEERSLFELDSDPSGTLVDDSDVIAAFETKAAEPRETPDFVTLLESAKNDYSVELVEALAAASVEDYRRAFKSRVGEPHRQLVYNALQYSRISNATPPMRLVTDKARQALLAIAAESTFNAFRVARFGVTTRNASQPAKGVESNGEPAAEHSDHGNSA